MRVQTLKVRVASFVIAILVSAVTIVVHAQAGSSPRGLDDASGKVSPSEMIAQSEQVIEDLRGTLGQVLEVLEKTREEEKDLLKLNCINEKLLGIKGFLKVSEQSLTKLKSSKSKGDVEAMRHHYKLITIAGTKVENLGVEAQSCAGDVLRYAGNTKVTPEIDPDIAEIDPTAIVNEGSDLWRLEEVTPYQ